MIALLLFAAAQAPDRLPAANPLPPPTVGDEGAIMAVIDAVFAGIAAHDASAVGAHLRSEGGATAVIEHDDGTREIKHRTWSEYLAGVKPVPQRYEERLTDAAIEVDGDMAMVWGPYVFLFDGQVHHCGTDHFDLVRENGAWKVLNITWTQRTRGCAP